MKLSATTLRTFTTVHAWMGLLAGLALFVAFYAGAFTVFQKPLMAWATPQPVVTAPPAAMQHLLDATLARHSAARTHLGMTFPGYLLGAPTAYWQEAGGTWLFATPDQLAGSPQRPGAALPELVNDLHYALGWPGAGTTFMGVIALLYGVALVSGALIYLPRFTREVFALRTGTHAKRFWQDAHTSIGVLSLPFHAMFAVTGAMLCLSAWLMLALGALGWQGKLLAAAGPAMDTAPLVAASGRARPLLPVDTWVARAQAVARDRGLAGFAPQYLKLAHAGDAAATVELTGRAPRTMGAATIALNAADGRLLAAQLPGQRDANHATLTWLYALHYGEYGNTLVPWLYFLLGLGGAGLFYSGNLLWIESHRRSRTTAQPLSARVMARATVGVCLGFCVALSVAGNAAQLLPWLGVAAADAERGTCLAAWFACLAWAGLRAPIRAARDLLVLAAATTALLPLTHGIATGAWFWRSLANGDLAPAMVDLGALVLAGVFALLARASARRAHTGEPHSVWAG